MTLDKESQELKLHCGRLEFPRLASQLRKDNNVSNQIVVIQNIQMNANEVLLEFQNKALYYVAYAWLACTHDGSNIKITMTMTKL